MLIVMKAGAAEQEVAAVVKVIEQLGYRPHVMPGATRTAIGITGNQGVVDPARFENMAGVELVEKYGDIIQIGARNMQNFSLLRRAGKSKLPVLLKRGMAATLDEWLLAAEYVMSEGNYQVILCERGVRTFALHTRNTLDLAAIPAVRRISHLPVVIDASHAAGKNYMVAPLARAGVAAGADGVLVEVHNDPKSALCDAAQALTLDEYLEMLRELRAIRNVIAH